MTGSSTAAPAVEVITVTPGIPTLGSLMVHGGHRHCRRQRRVHDGAPFGDRSDATALDLAHTDFDHIGSLSGLLELNPRLRVIACLGGSRLMGL